MPSATTMRLVKSRQTESTNASAILATQAAAFNAQMGERAINLYFTSYSQIGFKEAPNISFFQKWNTCKASWCRPGLSRAKPRQRVLCLRQRRPLALVGKIIQPIPVYIKGCYTFAWLLHHCACIATLTRIPCLVNRSIPFFSSPGNKLNTLI